jgi:saccharopine dehydrogenase-like NADP-dependent oxidoreductase
MDLIIDYKNELLSLGVFLAAGGLFIYNHKFKPLLTDTLPQLRNVDLTNKVIVVTGANTGIGYETALDLARRGGRVILACRDLESANKAAEKIRKQTRNQNVTTKCLDLASFDSVKQFAASLSNLKSIDILINNAGLKPKLCFNLYVCTLRFKDELIYLFYC